MGAPRHWPGNRVLHYSNSEDAVSQGAVLNYDYDSRGNRTRSHDTHSGRTLQLDYDSGNQLAQVLLQETPTQRQCVQRYRYDAFGRRLAPYRIYQEGTGYAQHSANYFGWDGDKLVHTER